MKPIAIKILSAIFLLIFSVNLNAHDTSSRLDIMYFHATIRCQGCLTIEEFINNSLKSTFDKQLKDSSFKFSSIDFLQIDNEHYQNDYKFESQTLILSKKANGKEVKWKNLDKIWEYSADHQKFQKYIEEEINNFLKES